MLKSLPRRKPLVETREEIHPARMSQLQMPRPPAVRVAGRALAWLWAIATLTANHALDTLLRRDTPERRARCVQRALTRLGGGAAQVGRQLAMRLDLLPLDVATALLAIQDREPPFAIEEAIRRVEAAAGRPVDQLFEAFDPTPLRSTSLACEYHAVLKTGEHVVVKVRRPGVRERYAAECAAVGMLSKALEGIALLRPGFLEALRTELVALVTKELDFRNQARYQTLFRRRTRRDRLRFVGAARIHHEVLSDAVLMSEFVSGVRLSEVVSAVTRDDAAALATLAEMDIHPRAVGRRLWEVSWWGLFENQFFDAEPSPDAIVVEPGGRLVFVGFGEFFTALGKTRRTLREMLARLAADDVSGSTEVVVQGLAPLPFIDTHAFTKRMESRIWQSYFALQDRFAPWHERTTAGITMGVLLTAGEDEVPVRSDLANMLRSLLLYDTFVLRVCPSLKLLDEFRRYQRNAERRAARRFQRKLDDSMADGMRAQVLANAARGLRAMDRMTFWVESVSENLPVSNLSMTSKGSTVASELVALVFKGVGLWFGAALALGLWRLARGEPVRALALLGEVGRHPAMLAVIALLVLLALRRVQFRLQDKDPNE